MNSKDLTIGVLATTAAVLLTGFLVIHSRPNTAFASGMTAQGGDYVITIGQFDNNEEMIYVIDAATETMLAYRFDPRSKRIEIANPVLDLRKLENASTEADAKKGKKR